MERALCIFILVTVTSAVFAQVPPFSAGSRIDIISTSDVSEASGLAASRKHDHVLYTHNDHGDSPRIYAINALDATVISTISIDGAQHNDWEDIAVGPCKEGICIFIADTGLYHHKAANKIYKVLEPDNLLPNMSLPVLSTAQFSWVEEESQTLLVAADQKVYVVGNVHGGRGMVSEIPEDAWGASTRKDITSFNFLPIHTHHHDPVSGDISVNGTELLIKTKSNIYYWKIEDNDVMAAIRKVPITVPYHHETLGEAICWSANGQNYYTLGEGLHQPLYLYTRLSGNVAPEVVG